MRPYIAPVAAVLILLTALPYHALWADPYPDLLTPAVYASGLLVLVLSQLFNFGRIGLTSALVLLCFTIIQWQLQAPLQNDTTYWWYFWLSLLWPINVAALRFFPELKPLSAAGFIAAVIVGAQVALITLLREPLAGSGLTLWLGQFRDQHGGGLLPLPGWISFAAAIALLLTRLPRKPDVPLAMVAVIVMHGWMFFSFATPFASLATAFISQLLLALVLIVSNHQLAFQDELTGLPGRRALMNDLKHRHGQYLLAMADIDHFKKFNDTHGHDVGDDVLRLVASQLGQIEGGGRAYRYGGEEFTLVFPAQTPEQCRPFIEAVRERIAHYPLVVRNQQQRPADSRDGRKKRGQTSKGKVLNVTMSFGVAQRQRGESIEAVMKRADKALYKAKQNGRNRVEDAVS